jgi:hypothetical protein
MMGSWISDAVPEVHVSGAHGKAWVQTRSIAGMAVMSGLTSDDDIPAFGRDTDDSVLAPNQGTWLGPRTTRIAEGSLLSGITSNGNGLIARGAALSW